MIQIMFFALKQKFTQNRLLREMLLSTGDGEIVECSRWDYYWGAGLGVNDTPFLQDPNGLRGRNRLGRLLMTLRDMIRSNTLL